ncbi:hypothetical protein AY599_18380 [Leptolyngbya valderiana BDU 20041]|nr:hypothetical protein AY599_18380 [Leptolyngbya valderiana BDU 20041]
MSLRGRLERGLNRIWYDSESPPLALRAVEFAYGSIVRRRSLRPASRPPVPVIVVGNLSVGGSGKTPTVRALVDALREDYRLAVISRGYGASTRQFPRLVDASMAVEESGDEALLLARETGVPVWIDPHRRRALEQAVEASGAEVVISDDGLQHVKLPRSYEVCLFDGERGCGNGHLLPAGPLRQPLNRLESVDQILIKGPGMEWPCADHFALEPVAIRPFDVWTEAEGSSRIEGESLESWQGRAVRAVCGIAHPGQFQRALEALGMRVELHAFADHHRFVEADLAAIEAPIITTAKDAVKLGLWARGQGVHVLDVRANLPEHVIERVQQHIEEFHGKD